MRHLVLALALPFCLTACNNSLTPIRPFDSGLPPDDLAQSGGGGSDGGGTVAHDLSTVTLDMTGFNQAGSPTVTITSPASMAEISGDTLAVSAKIVSPTNTPIKADSVLITITPPGGGVQTAAMSLTATAGVYTGSIDIGDVPSGNASFTVSASDTAGLTGSASAAYVHDHGATITFVQPAAATAHGTVILEAIIDDPLHPIMMLSQVKASIRSPGDITLTQVAGASPFRVTATIDLNAFSPTLDGPQLITVTATNSNNTKTTAAKPFTIDNAGPDIVITSPAAGSFVGGVVTIQATITDLSDVNQSTVVAVFGGNLATSVPLELTDPKNNVYSNVFDVRALGRNYVFPELSVRADDKLGNHGEIGQEIVVDNTPPWITMNGAVQMRVSKDDPAKLPECSQLFRPLGPVGESTAEGDKVLQIVTLRARVEDRANTAPGLLEPLISGIDGTSVELFAIPSTAGAILAVDTDGDGECDDVNPTLIPTSDVMMSGEALALQMGPLAQGTGSPDYTAGAGTPAGCHEIGEASFTPTDPLCIGTSMKYVLPVNDAVGPIWSIAPVTAKQCVGFQLDTLNRLPEGPTCVVTRAVDKAGNQNVSFPLHICIDRGGHHCDTFSFNNLDCTGKYDKVAKMIVPGTCNPPVAGTTGFITDGSEVRDLTKIVSQ